MSAHILLHSLHREYYINKMHMQSHTMDGIELSEQQMERTADFEDMRRVCTLCHSMHRSRIQMFSNCQTPHLASTLCSRQFRPQSIDAVAVANGNARQRQRPSANDAKRTHNWPLRLIRFYMRSARSLFGAQKNKKQQQKTEN